MRDYQFDQAAHKKDQESSSHIKEDLETKRGQLEEWSTTAYGEVCFPAPVSFRPCRSCLLTPFARQLVLRLPAPEAYRMLYTLPCFPCQDSYSGRYCQYHNVVACLMQASGPASASMQPPLTCRWPDSTRGLVLLSVDAKNLADLVDLVDGSPVGAAQH